MGQQCEVDVDIRVPFKSTRWVIVVILNRLERKLGIPIYGKNLCYHIGAPYPHTHPVTDSHGFTMNCDGELASWVITNHPKTGVVNRVNPSQQRASSTSDWSWDMNSGAMAW